MRKLLAFLITISALFIVYVYRNQLFEYIVLNYIYKTEFTTKNANEYTIDYDFKYIKETDIYKPTNKQDILNIIYSGLNNGLDEFSYFCTLDYENCIEDSKNITNDDVKISYLNNFIHPYNSFYNIKISINNLGKVTISVNKLYDNKEITIINEKIDQIYNEITNEDMTTKDKIKAIHDYIINNSIYDEEKADNLNNPNYIAKYKSQTAYGPLLQGYGICSGYSDAMAIFLNKMNIPNYRISSINHVWNLVYLDGKWLHLDLTWDDPVVNTKENLLLHNFFLINSDELKKKNTGQHDYDANIFLETIH